MGQVTCTLTCGSDKVTHLSDHGQIGIPREWAVTTAGLRNCFTGCSVTTTTQPPTPQTGGSISRDAMCWSEIEMLSLKLVVRKICQLQSDKNATKQAGNKGREIWEAIFRVGSDQLMAITTREGKKGKAQGVKFHPLHLHYSILHLYILYNTYCIYSACTLKQHLHLMQPC